MTYTIEQYQNREEYFRSIFRVIIEVVETSRADASDAAKLTAIKNMAQVGVDGTVITGDYFTGEGIASLMLHEAETELGTIGTGQPEAKALTQIQFTATRLEALLETIHTALHGASDDQVGDAAMLAGWAAEIAGEIGTDLDIYDIQRSKGKPVY